MSPCRFAAASLCALPLLAAAAEAPPAVDSAAVSTERVTPAFPKKALEKKLDGCVALSFGIDAEGRPTDVQVLESRPQGTFDAATLKAFRQWRFAQPPRPGRYAQLLNFAFEKRTQANTCKPLPSFAALNPDTPPTPTRLQVYQRVMPRYEGRDLPTDGGCVTVKFEVKHDGFVGDVEVLEAKPESMAEPAVAAMKQWVFQSFPRTEARVHATQTFFFTPETMRMPQEAIRGSYGVLGQGGALNSVGCGSAPAKPAVADGMAANSGESSGAGKK